MIKDDGSSSWMVSLPDETYNCPLNRNHCMMGSDQCPYFEVIASKDTYVECFCKIPKSVRYIGKFYDKNQNSETSI